MASKTANVKRTVRILTIIHTLSFIFLCSGCATSQKVNPSVLEESKHKTFTLGVVKAAVVGDITPFNIGPAYIDKKINALARIPIEEISSILSMQYGIKIGMIVDRSPVIVKEQYRSGQGWHSITESAYYGNLEYNNRLPNNIMHNGAPSIINDQTMPDVVYISYWMENHAFFNMRFNYSIHVISSGKEVLQLQGIVKSIKADKGWGGINRDSVWEAYIEYAGHINEALKRDLAEAAKN